MTLLLQCIYKNNNDVFNLNTIIYIYGQLIVNMEALKEKNGNAVLEASADIIEAICCEVQLFLQISINHILHPYTYTYSNI